MASAQAIEGRLLDLKNRDFLAGVVALMAQEKGEAGPTTNEALTELLKAVAELSAQEMEKRLAERADWRLALSESRSKAPLTALALDDLPMALTLARAAHLADPESGNDMCWAWAASWRMPEAIEALIPYGRADRQSNATSALETAIHAGCLRCVRGLAPLYGMEQRSTALRLAASLGRASEALELIAHGVEGSAVEAAEQRASEMGFADLALRIREAAMAKQESEALDRALAARVGKPGAFKGI